ncbi:hypothetical protein V1506DRAFT_508463 [Lipomyces tetrasporus]
MLSRTLRRSPVKALDEHWNNLGVYNVGQNLASVREVVPSDMQKVFHINVNAPTLLASKLLRATKKIVLVSSVAVSFDFTKDFGSFLTQLELHSFTPLLSPREPDQACVIEVGTSESLTKLQ